jgi:hypothetical protein
MKEGTMTETMIELPGAIAKSDDADFLRELIQNAAQRLSSAPRPTTWMACWCARSA